MGIQRRTWAAMTDERAEEIRASVAGVREAQEVLWRLEDAGAAPAEREPARQRAEAAADRVDEALTAQDDDTDVNVDRLRGLRAAIAWWREKRNLEVPVAEPVLIDGEIFDLGGWIAHPPLSARPGPALAAGSPGRAGHAMAAAPYLAGQQHRQCPVGRHPRRPGDVRAVAIYRRAAGQAGDQAAAPSYGRAGRAFGLAAPS